MKIASFFITILLIIACNNAAKNKEGTKKDTATPATQLPEKFFPDTIFNGLGTEPFWFVYVIKDDRIVFHSSEGPDVEVPFVVAATPDNITTKYNSAGSNNSIDLTIIKKNCSDGMSDIVHPYEVMLSVNGKNYSGCGK